MSRTNKSKAPNYRKEKKPARKETQRKHRAETKQALHTLGVMVDVGEDLAEEPPKQPRTSGWVTW